MSKQNIESYQNQIQKLIEENEELEQQLAQFTEEMSSKDEAIQKASMVIQMLREDLEKAVQDLQESENERDDYKKNWKDSQKQLSNLNTSRLKSEMELQVRQFSSREKELQLKFEEENEANKLLQQQIDEMQSEIDMLTQRNKSNQKEMLQLKNQFKQQEANEDILKEKLQYKESQLTEKLSQISSFKQSFQEQETYYQNEIQLLKKVIENQNKFKFTPINKTPAQPSQNDVFHQLIPKQYTELSITFQFQKSNIGTPKKQNDPFNDTLEQSYIVRNTMSQKKPNIKKRSTSQQCLSSRKFNSQSMSNLHFEEKPIGNQMKLKQSAVNKYENNENSK